MDFEAVKAWLARRTQKQSGNCRLLGMLGLVLAPVALIVATICVYWLLRLFTHDASYNPGDPTLCLLISLAVIPCLFIGNRLVPHRDLMEEQLSEGPDRSIRRQVVPLFFLWILFTGPRLFDWAFRSFGEARRWRGMDIHSCAAVLWLLISKPGKVSFDDMRQQLDWLNLDAVLPDITRIPGIVFLKTPPPGLSLTQDFRDQVRSEITR
jgi:hypothetical protein